MKKLGGKRPGAGRPHGTGRYKEVTHPVRIPISLMSKVNGMLEAYRKKQHGIQKEKGNERVYNNSKRQEDGRF